MAKRIEQTDDERALELAFDIREAEYCGVSGGFLRRRLLALFGDELALAALTEADRQIEEAFAELAERRR